MTIKRKKVGLALGSGGVKGIAHIGVIKTLLANNIPIDFMAGTSSGALIGAHFALFKDLEILSDIIVSQKKEKLIIFLEPSLGGGLIGGKRIEALLNKWLNGLEFSDTKIPFQALATDLISGNQVIFSQGKIVPALMASMAVPTIFKPYAYQGKTLVDGGLSNPVPDDLVRSMGADIVISVNLDNYQDDGDVDYRNSSLVTVARRSLDVMRHNLARYSNIHSDIIIAPDIKTVGLRSWQKYFTAELGPQLIKIGEKETEKFIPQIKKLLV